MIDKSREAYVVPVGPGGMLGRIGRVHDIEFRLDTSAARVVEMNENQQRRLHIRLFSRWRVCRLANETRQIECNKTDQCVLTRSRAASR